MRIKFNLSDNEMLRWFSAATEDLLTNGFSKDDSASVQSRQLGAIELASQISNGAVRVENSTITKAAEKLIDAADDVAEWRLSMRKAGLA